VVIHPGAAGFLASVALGTFVGGGKLVILAGTVERAPVGVWELAALVVYMDLATTLVVLGGIHHVFRLPGIGTRIASSRDASARMLERNPWMRRIASLSLAGFVAVPLNGTGALVGAALGRMMGLTRGAIVASVAGGSVAGSVALALAGRLWAERINDLVSRPRLGLVVVALTVIVTVSVARWALGRPGHRAAGGEGRTEGDDPAEAEERVGPTVI